MAGVYFVHRQAFYFVHIPWDEIRLIERGESRGFVVTITGTANKIYWIEPISLTKILHSEHGLQLLRTIFDDLSCPDVDIDITYTAEERHTDEGEPYIEFVRSRGRPQRTEAQLPKED